MRALVIPVALLSLAACQGYQTQACGVGEPQIGMTEAEVLSTSWCAPIRRDNTVSATGTTDYWYYEGNRFITFQDGKAWLIGK